MSKGILHTKGRIILHNLFIIIILVSCGKKDRFSWNPGLSAPKNYPSGAPRVEYFYQGKSITGASSGTGANAGWGIPSGGYSVGDQYKQVPDSVAVKWVCSVDNYFYKGGIKLPRETLLQYFREGFKNAYGKQDVYNLLVAGMAPGGNVTIWLMGSDRETEIIKFKAQERLEDDNIDKEYKEKSVKYWNNYLIPWTLYGVPYKVWEDSEPLYNYDISFSSENKTYKYDFYITSKDGSFFSDEFYDIVVWQDRFLLDYRNQKHRDKKLPVQINMQWYSKDERYWYEGSVIMPQNLSTYFDKKGYGRILISMIDNNENFAKGIIYFIGNNKVIKIMDFRLGRYNYEEKKLMSPKYSLPKGFKFPKWEGRIPLATPKFNYWIEE